MANEPNGVNSPHSSIRSPTAFDRSLAVCAGNPSHAGGFRQQGRGKMSRSQRETGSGAARDPGVCQLQRIPSPSRLCIICQRAGHRFAQTGLGCLVPCRNLRPVFHHFRHHHRRNLSLSRLRELFSRLRITSQSSRARLDMCARRPGARIPSVSASGVKYFAHT